jgi:hypothetical protein
MVLHWLITQEIGFLGAQVILMANVLLFWSGHLHQIHGRFLVMVMVLQSIPTVVLIEVTVTRTVTRKKRGQALGTIGIVTVLTL